MQSKIAIVIGAGIVGLATAKSLAEKGYKVTVFERNEKAIGASIRNFGMIWPIGQCNGHLYERALRSKSIWKQVLHEASLWYEERGSIHLAYNDLEWQVLNEFAEVNSGIRPVKVLSAADALEKSEAVNGAGLKGGLYSEDEMIIESRVVMEQLPLFLQEKYGVHFYFNTAISNINYPNVYSGKRKWAADLVFVCNGADFETLYPEVFNENFTKCKLQMMRLVEQPGQWRIGPSLCGGLSLIHYKSFEQAPMLTRLKEFYEQSLPEYLQWGIHVMIAQNKEGALTIGDSHEYGLAPDPFDKEAINRMIIDYLKTFVVLKDWRLLQSWNGIYPKMLNGSSDFVYQPEDGVTIINGLGGAGMTLSFGFAEDVVNHVLGLSRYKISYTCRK